VSLRVGLSVTSPRLFVPHGCGLSTSIPHANEKIRNYYFSQLNLQHQKLVEIREIRGKQKTVTKFPFYNIIKTRM